MFGRCAIFLPSGRRCPEIAVARCDVDGAPFCAAHRGFEGGDPRDDLCAACEGRADGARRDARAVALDQEVAANQLVKDPARIADLVRQRHLRTTVGTTSRTVSGGWLKGDRTEVEEVRFWLITREPEGDQEVGLGLTTHGAWVRHSRPAGSGLPPALQAGVQPSTDGAREVMAWLDRQRIDLADLH